MDMKHGGQMIGDDIGSSKGGEQNKVQRILMVIAYAVA